MARMPSHLLRYIILACAEHACHANLHCIFRSMLPEMCGFSRGVYLLAQVVDSLKKGYQAMIFVHSRKDTGKTARALAVKAQNAGDMALFDCSEHPQYGFLQKDVKKSRNR